MKKKLLQSVGINDLWLTLYFAALIINMFHQSAVPAYSRRGKSRTRHSHAHGYRGACGIFCQQRFYRKEKHVPSASRRKNAQKLSIYSSGGSRHGGIVHDDSRTIRGKRHLFRRFVVTGKRSLPCLGSFSYGHILIFTALTICIP